VVQAKTPSKAYVINASTNFFLIVTA
jgi:hypothetical protein